MRATSDLVVSLKPTAVLILGDSQYENGSSDAFKKAWSNNWGRDELKDITYPSVGNHEYNTPGAKGYFDFFGSRAGERGKGYYSFNLGTWHIIALNTGGNDRCRPVSCENGAEQKKWLREDLKENSQSCTLAFWHRPLFTSGLHRGAVEVKPFWRDLYDAGADLNLNGHSQGAPIADLPGLAYGTKLHWIRRAVLCQSSGPCRSARDPLRSEGRSG
jgi:3',5'-cyclic AMP phosphodiesterase CpdA